MVALITVAGCAAPTAAGEPVGPVSGAASTTTTVSTSRPGITVPPLTAGPTGTPTTGSSEPSEPSASVEPPATTTPEVAPPVTTEPAPAPTPVTEPAAPEPPAGPALTPLQPPYVHVVGSLGDGRTVYLTFDDGPGPQTAAFLDVLAGKGVRATFCQVGNRLAEFPAVAQRVVAEGHTLCNHSWDHRLHLGSADASDVDAEITRTQDAVAALGASSHWFRAPGGDFGTTDTLRQVAQARGVVPLGWAVDSRDWTKPGVDVIVANVLSAVTPGAVVLLHDAGGTDRDQTLAALPGIIDGLRAAGYDLQPLPPGGI